MRAWSSPSTVRVCSFGPPRPFAGSPRIGSRGAHRKEGKAAFLVEAEATGSQGRRRSDLRHDRGRRRPMSPSGCSCPRATRVVMRSRRYLANGIPSRSPPRTSRSPSRPGRRSPSTDTGPGGIYARIEEQGHELAHFTEEVTARMPTPEERKALQIGAGVPVMTLVRTAYDTDDVPGRGLRHRQGRPTPTCWSTTSRRADQRKHPSVRFRSRRMRPCQLNSSRRLCSL